MKKLEKAIICIASIILMLLTVPMAFVYISEELLYLRVTYVFFLVWLFGVAPILLWLTEKKTEEALEIASQ